MTISVVVEFKGRTFRNGFVCEDDRDIYNFDHVLKDHMYTLAALAQEFFAKPPKCDKCHQELPR